MSARFANVSEVPLALAVFLASDFYDHNDDPFTISATTLLKPLRQIILPTRIPAGEGLVNLADMMNSRMGTAIHDAIEKAWMQNYKGAMEAIGYPQKVIDKVKINPTKEELTDDCYPIYLEQRLKRQLGKWTVTGKFDFIGEGRVQDFKSTSTYTYTKQTNGEKYTQQGSIYRWLDPELITQDQMDIHYIFTDWKPAQAKTDPSYPPKRFHKQSFDLMSLMETESFIRRKIALIEQYWDAPEADIPECDDSELWRSEPVFKYYKNPDKTARSTKNFTTKPEAYAFMAEQGNVGIVKEVSGQVTACKYCPAFITCAQKDRLVAAGDLVL
ncbi:MAG: hypothetical protein E6R03_16795 [Hyphomicrobiaceae bacterium]|nr:MAG: hypothetical protein E6R03_16795 [Hyphomicrobiaceae bacterium]